MKSQWDLTGTVLRFFPGGVIIFDLDGKGLVNNETLSTMFGLKPGELIDFQCFNGETFFDEGDRSVLNDKFKQTLEGKTSSPAEFSMHRRDGDTLSIELLIGPILDENSNVAAVGILAFDITERKLLEKEREEMGLEYLHASRMATLGELARGIAHNINNPLVGLYGYLELMSEDYPGDDRIAKSIEQCNRIGEMARNLAYHGRNTELMERIRVDLHELINETLQLISSSKLYDNLQIETEYSEQPAIVIVNPGDLTQVLINLLRNARDAVWDKENGKITIRTVNQDDETILSITDNGHGIPDSITDNIFVPFFTTKGRGPSSSEAPTGNGLGLSSSRHLLEQNGGRIDFTSKVGGGSTFNVYLPRAPGLI